MNDRYDVILGMPWLMKYEPWIDYRSRTVGASHKPLAERASVGNVPSSSREGFVNKHRIPRSERLFASSAEIVHEEGRRGSTEASVGVEAGSPFTTEVAIEGACESGSAAVTTAQEVTVAVRHVSEGDALPPSPEDLTVGGCKSNNAVVTTVQEIAVVGRRVKSD